MTRASTMTLVAVERIEPTSLDYQSSALAVELHREVVDPTGLKPAPHGLKGRRSVTRAPGQWIGCGGRVRTFDSRINNPVPYQLGYATKELAAAARFELAHPRLQDECSVIRLSYAAIWWTGRDSNPHKKFAGLLCCRLHHQPKNISDCQFLIADCVSGAGTHRL